jgi:tRNA (cytidine32/uridine32-2'-O)-methyltransferase
MLAQVKIVLVEPTHPGNIGAVARAMKTMGLSCLNLVNPKKFPHYEASKRAAGADSVLENAVVTDTLREAISDCQVIYGTSVRDREVTWPTFTPNEVAQDILEVCAVEASSTSQSQQSVAILFGRESSGLTNEELSFCQSQIRIPANDEYSSLNLASAVQIIAYEIRMAYLANSLEEDSSEEALSPAKQRQQLASLQEREGYYAHLLETIEKLDFIKSKPPTKLMRKLTRLYNKADMSVEEVQILRGILTAFAQQLEMQSGKQSKQE